MSMQDVPQVVEDWREDGRMAGDLDGEMLQRLPAHEIPQQEAATSLCVLTLHGMTPDVLEKILSWVDVERDVLKAALVSKTFSSCMHSHGVWAKFWEVRWPSEGVDREEHSQGAFRARYAAELRWDFREETRIIVSKLVSGRTAGAHAPAPAPLVKLAWIWQEGSHVAVASGQQVLVVDHASLYNGSLCNGRVSVEEGWGPEQLIQVRDCVCFASPKCCCLNFCVRVIFAQPYASAVGWISLTVHACV